MKKTLLKIFLILIICLLPCVKYCNSGETGGSSIFDENLLANVKSDLEYYRASKTFTVVETPRQDGDNPWLFPEYWYQAENDEINIAFWPDYDAAYDGDEAPYKLQFIDIKKKTKKYFLGQFIGMNARDLFKKYPAPQGYEEIPQGQNYLIYRNADNSQLVNFWLEDNVVIRAGFAYSLQ